jgi:dihydrofolate reductase
MMKIALIVAASQNNVIGLDNQLPWHLPEDLQYFKAVTMGKPILMGRKTYDSIGRPLPGRTNIVLTRDANWSAEGVVVVNDLDSATAASEKACVAAGVDELMIIGGEQIYRKFLPVADKLYLTKVEAVVEGDAYFPAIDSDQWQQVAEKIPEEVGNYSYRFVVLERMARLS